jgi:hypothetical protein
MPCDGFDPAGRAVVITGRINQPWMLIGPFCDMEAAGQWAAASNINSDRVIKFKSPIGERKWATNQQGANHDNQKCLSPPFNREGISRFQKHRHRFVHGGA